MAAPEPRTYTLTVPAHARLVEKFDKLARRAAKLGVPAPELHEVGRETREEVVDVRDGETTGHAEHTGRTYEVVLVTVSGDAPKYAGWLPVAVIDRDLEEPDSPNVVNLIGEAPGVRALASIWRGLGDVCDHCAANGYAGPRGRRKLVVVEHDQGDRAVKVVGLTCVRDFLGGQSPDAIASWLEVLSGLDDLLTGAEDDGDDFRSGRVEYRYPPVGFLAVVAAEIDEGGWVSKAKASEHDGLVSTAERARERYTWRPSKFEPVRPTPPTDAQVELAEAAIEWALTISLDEANDYLANVRAVAGKSGWRVRDLGIGASIVSTYSRNLARDAERSARAEALADSKHVGSIGDRFVLTATVLSVSVHGGEFFAPYSIVKLLDDQGCAFVTFTSTEAPTVGSRVTGKATVKDHSVYQGVAETKVSRYSWTYALPEDGSCPCTDDGEHDLVSGPYGEPPKQTKADVKKGVAACWACGNKVPLP